MVSSEIASAAIQQAAEEAAAWLADLATNGLDLTVTAHVKTAHEAAELAANPTLEEWADVAICLIGTALHHGWSADDLAAAIQLKVEINRLRTWDHQPDGSWQHRPQSTAGATDEH
jgi:hypothetical protein